MQLLVLALLACLAPLLIVVPVHYRGLARERAGKAPGWTDPGWRLFHVWLGLAWLVLAQVLVIYLMGPSAVESILSGTPPSGIEIATDGRLTADQVLWALTAEASCLVAILPGAPLRLLWTTRWSPAKALLAGWIAFLALKLATVVIVPWLPGIDSPEHPQRELTETLARITEERSFLATVLVVAVIVPLVEEVLFRGVLLTALARRISFVAANLIQAALFATLHGVTLLWPFFFLMGLVAGRMMRESGGLLPAIVLHVLNNGATLAFLWYLGRGGT